PKAPPTVERKADGIGHVDRAGGILGMVAAFFPVPTASAPSPAKVTLLGIAWPIFVEQALRMLVGAVDVFMVSHVSDGAVAAVGRANQIVILFLIAFNFVGIGSSVVITH